MIKYSIIVPVYKVEAVLSRCIESILNQTVSDFELILIDDGSPDRSGAICDEYAAKDPRIRVIHQDNGGVSRARNAGLDAAQGEYIVFVDSDDYVDVDYLENFERGLADLTVSGYQIEGYRISTAIVKNRECEIFSNLTQSTLSKLFENGDLNYVWSKCFSLSIIRKYSIYFDEALSLAEDTLFVVQYVQHCCSISSIPSVGYHYMKYPHETLTGGSLLSSVLIQRIELGNEKIYLTMEGYLGELAEIIVAKRIARLYKEILAEWLHRDDSPCAIVFFLFRQKWFRKSLDYVDQIYSDENPKYRFLLKTKSPYLFWIYLLYNKWNTKKNCGYRL